MSVVPTVMAAAQAVAGQGEQFRLDPSDFLGARDRGESAGTEVAQQTASLTDSLEILNTSVARGRQDGGYTNVISPVVTPKGGLSAWWLLAVALGVVVGLIGYNALAFTDGLTGDRTNAAVVLFGPHYWLALVLFTAFTLWRNTFVQIPDGCQALITKFGKLETVVGAGRTSLVDPRKRVSYIVNTTREYPYNAPIRQAPTSGRIDASVDLFLQFRIDDPVQFIFSLGGVNGFSEKLSNAVSEVTRALIYEQKAEGIYDLVGESTEGLLASLNNQFRPAVTFVNANITHAEPASREYRMDLAAAEVVRVAKEAYTNQYSLKLRKEQDEGDLNKELAGLKETLSEIRAQIARYQAHISTAREKEVNRANALARQRMSEAESEARANVALLEAQALDIRAIASAGHPEILQMRYQREILDKVRGTAGNLPQIVNVGDSSSIDYLAVAQELLGIQDTALFAEGDLDQIRQRAGSIEERIRSRHPRIEAIHAAAARVPGVDAPPAGGRGGHGTGAADEPAVEATTPGEVLR